MDAPLCRVFLNYFRNLRGNRGWTAAGHCGQGDEVVCSGSRELTGSSAHETGTKTGVKSGLVRPLSGLSRENLQGSIDAAVEVTN